MREEQLDGGSRRIDLGGGYSLVATGLQGRAVVHEQREDGTRGPESATVTLDEALSAAGVFEVRTIELEVQATPVPPDAEPVRSASGEDALELEVPDLGPETGQVVLSVDEAGVVTWNFAESDGTVRRFRVARRIPPAPAEGTERGLIGTLGKKFLKVLVYPLTDPILGAVGEQFAAMWEKAHRPHSLRWFTPDDYAETEGRAVAPEDWATLAAGPALLFVHGTFSTAHGGFGGLPKETMQELFTRYEGRVFAFDHPSLSVSPEQNAAWFISQIPPGVKLDLDLIGHSRGGLVSRMLAERPCDALNVRRVVFVGTPNRGTQLADPAHMIDMLDRFTTVLNFIPVKSAQLVLESILVVVKVLGRSFLGGLPGLTSMDPAGPFQAQVNGAGTGCRTLYYGITSDFEPTEPGLIHFVRDQGMDRVFGEANDLVVPTAGVYGAGHPNFPIPPERLLAFGPQDGVLHVTYFEKPATGEHLLKWLSPLPGSLSEVAAGKS